MIFSTMIFRKWGSNYVRTAEDLFSVSCSHCSLSLMPILFVTKHWGTSLFLESLYLSVTWQSLYNSMSHFCTWDLKSVAPISCQWQQHIIILTMETVLKLFHIITGYQNKYATTLCFCSLGGAVGCRWRRRSFLTDGRAGVSSLFLIGCCWFVFFVHGRPAGTGFRCFAESFI